MATCFFCANPPNSKEDLFPRWILKRVKTREPLSRRIGNAEADLTWDQEVRIPCVCMKCNNGWMSRMEVKRGPLIGNLLADISMPLDMGQQMSIAEWALKCAMVIDAGRVGERFFRPDESHEFKKSRAIPNGTGVWIGRFAGSSLSAINGGATLQDMDGKTLADFHVFTMLVGHLVMQVLSIHERPGHQIRTINLAAANSQDWSLLLRQIWPTIKKISWPPPLSFSNYGAHPYGELVYRWREQKGHSVIVTTPNPAAISPPKP